MAAVCEPCYGTLSDIFPETAPLLRGMQDNCHQWQRISEGKSTAMWQPDCSYVLGSSPSPEFNENRRSTFCSRRESTSSSLSQQPTARQERRATLPIQHPLIGISTVLVSEPSQISSLNEDTGNCI